MEELNFNSFYIPLPFHQTKWMCTYIHAKRRRVIIWMLSSSVSILCLCVLKLKNGHKLTFHHHPTHPPGNIFWCQMKGIAKIRLFVSSIMVLILLPLKDIAHFVFYNFIIYNVYNEAKILPLWSLATLCLYKVIKKEGG